MLSVNGNHWSAMLTCTERNLHRLQNAMHTLCYLVSRQQARNQNISLLPSHPVVMLTGASCFDVDNHVVYVHDVSRNNWSTVLSCTD